jgi:hypothetical protein
VVGTGSSTGRGRTIVVVGDGSLQVENGDTACVSDGTSPGTAVAEAIASSSRVGAGVGELGAGAGAGATERVPAASDRPAAVDSAGTAAPAAP